eukprot:12913362-Prorocentrum_lima.AAC.1
MKPPTAPKALEGTTGAGAHIFAVASGTNTLCLTCCSGSGLWGSALNSYVTHMVVEDEPCDCHWH